MSQAEKLHTPIPSRRALLARAPAVAALALAVPASALAGVVTGGDTELLALGERLDWLVAEEARIYELERPYRDAFERVIDEMKAEGRPHSTEEWEARLRPVENLRTAPTSDDLTDQMDAPMRRIMELPAYTLAGLAVKARTTAEACSLVYRADDVADAEWDDMHIRHLIAAVLTMAGQPLIDGEI
jgi:hypothetical protein